MNKKFAAAVDLGATSGRVMLAAVSDEGISLREIHRFPNHLIPVGNHLHWDIYELYRQVLVGLKSIASEGIPLDSIGVDTWGCDFVCVGADGAFLRLPYAYRDSQNNGAAERYFLEHPRDRIYGITGIQVMDFNSLFQMHTLRQRNDSAWSAAEKLLFVPDAMSYLMTGEAVCEYTIATTAQIVDAMRRCLSPEVLATVGLTEKNFGRFVRPGEIIGHLTPELQRQTGLGPVPVIAVGGHDTSSAVAAVPATTSRFAYLSSGTWSLMGVELAEPQISEDTARLNFTNEGGVCGSIRLLKNICGMWLLERCREKCPEVPYSEWMEAAEMAEPFRSLIDPDAPDFAMPDDMEEAIMNYCRRTGQHVPENRGELARCIFESLALRYRQVLEGLEHLSGQRVEVLHIIGGGSRNRLLNRWTAQSIGRLVVAGPSEATAWGNVMLQRIAADISLSLDMLRSELAAQLPLERFQPEKGDAWEAGYRKFLKIIL
ncbi:MAG: rhamnulokinase [Bacteroidales bacterium]|nr:rhamnulokinase [Bacteroidales bacterium]